MIVGSLAKARSNFLVFLEMLSNRSGSSTTSGVSVSSSSFGDPNISISSSVIASVKLPIIGSEIGGTFRVLFASKSFISALVAMEKRCLAVENLVLTVLNSTVWEGSKPAVLMGR